MTTRIAAAKASLAGAADLRPKPVATPANFEHSPATP